MVLWALSLLLSPTPSTTHLVLGLAVVLATLIVVAAATGTGVWRTEVTRAPGEQAPSSECPRPRLADPDAAGRPRPRAPSARPTAA